MVGDGRRPVDADPAARELDKRSIDGDAYVCASANRYVYCFIKPDMMM